MQDYNRLTGNYNGIGWGNFEGIFKSRDFKNAILNSSLYAVMVVPIGLVISLFFASLLNKRLKGTAIYQTAFFLPLVTSTVAIGFVWRFMFNGNYGVLNSILSIFGVDKIKWLEDSRYSLTTIVIYGIWSSIPFSTIVLLSAMQSINKKYYIIARMDNASSFQMFKKITLPMMMPTIIILMFLNLISSFKVFDELQVFFGGPGPYSNLYTIVWYIYEQMRTGIYGVGYAAAASIVLFVFVLSATLLLVLIRKVWLNRGKRLVRSKRNA
jgi:multiple sugar transport system permease protein